MQRHKRVAPAKARTLADEQEHITARSGSRSSNAKKQRGHRDNTPKRSKRYLPLTQEEKQAKRIREQQIVDDYLAQQRGAGRFIDHSAEDEQDDEADER